MQFYCGIIIELWGGHDGYFVKFVRVLCCSTTYYIMNKNDVVARLRKSMEL